MVLDPPVPPLPEVPVPDVVVVGGVVVVVDPGELVVVEELVVVVVGPVVVVVDGETPEIGDVVVVVDVVVVDVVVVGPGLVLFAGGAKPSTAPSIIGSPPSMPSVQTPMPPKWKNCASWVTRYKELGSSKKSSYHCPLVW